MVAELARRPGRGRCCPTTAWRPRPFPGRASRTRARPGRRCSPRAGRRGGSRSAATAPAAGSPSRCCTCILAGGRAAAGGGGGVQPVDRPDARRARASRRLARRDAFLPAARIDGGARPVSRRRRSRRSARLAHLGRFAGAPPVLIQASRAEILLDDARLMAARLAADGVAVDARPLATGAARLAGLPRPAARGRRRARPRRRRFVAAASRSA